MSIKYAKPKILLIDLPASVEARLRAEGFNAVAGTFGAPYKVPQNDQLQPVIAAAHLPNHTEQEVIFIDLTPPDTLEAPEGGKATSAGELDWWAKCSRGEIDPRPRIMASVQGAFNRVLDHGGLFVVFAQPRTKPGFLHGRVIYGDFHFERHIPYDNWCFLSFFADDHLTIQYDYGTEMSRAANGGFLYRCISPYLKDAEYTATFHAASWFDSEHRAFLPLAVSKFLAPVSGLILLKSKGMILLLPQINNKAEVIVDLLTTALPEASPHLFPHFEGKRWLERDEYEHQSVLDCKRRQTEIQQAARRQIEQLDQEIEAEHNRLGFLHALLTKTDRELVEAVKMALGFIGFQQVTDVDAESDEAANKQEDLQVLDPPQPLLLEIKGLAGLPTESDTLQVSKYVLRRMKQWNKTDIRGVSIINHQRNLPALDRNHDKVFTSQQVEDADNHDIALLTTWTLFCLIRGMIQWRWPPDAIRGLLYQDGQIPRLPTHYRPIGSVTHFWDKASAMSIELAEGAVLRQGDTLGFVLPDRFHEEKAESLQIDKHQVEEAQGGDTVGHKTSLKRSDVPDGTIVYVVKATP